MIQQALTENRLLLNCDIGEQDNGATLLESAVMPLIDLANIACGGHAGDLETMQQTVALATQHHTLIGAHPSYPDRIHFGRKSVSFSPDELTQMLIEQIDTLQRICHQQGTALSYIKPHGALYNDMQKNVYIREAVFDAVHQYDADLPIMTLATMDTTDIEQTATYMGVSLIYEAFADRAYDKEGFLVPRNQSNAVYHHINDMVEQAKLLATDGLIRTQSNTLLSLKVQTLCVHGDSPDAITALTQIRLVLDALAH